MPPQPVPENAMTESQSFTREEGAEWHRSRHEERTYTGESTSEADTICLDCSNPFSSYTAAAGDFGLCDLCYYSG